MRTIFACAVIGLLPVCGVRADTDATLDRTCCAAPDMQKDENSGSAGEQGKPARKPQTAAKGTTMDTISGAYSGIRQPRNVVIRDAKAFEALWKEHAQGRELPIPPVDFKKYDVVGVFAGSKNTGGYAVDLGEIKRNGKTATVNATLLKPAPGAMVTQAFTYPFALRAVPKLPPTVKFVIKEQARQ